MKKEMFNLLVERILAQPNLFSTHKVTIKDGLEVHTFGATSNTDLAEAKKLFKEKGYKTADVQDAATALASKGKLQNTYLTLLYGAEKDKISISIFEMGYAYAGRKDRFYPLRKNIPVFAWTKHMYDLQPRGRGGSKSNPRIQLGEIGLYGWFPAIGKIITQTFLQIDYSPNARISYRHFAGTKNDFEAIGNMFGVVVPKALHRFLCSDVIALYKTIQDFNQINKLCQFMNKDSGFIQVDQPFSTNTEPWVHPMDLWQTISKMLFKDHSEYWVVRDYVGDNISLKKRNVSLKVTSIKRWKDEHQKAAMLRVIKGTPEITVDEAYKKALEGLEYPYELIETKDRLVQESVELHHCVATYADRINRGRCAIFSVQFEGKRYTLEVRFDAVGDEIVFTPIQFRGLCNEAAPEVIGKRVAEVLALNKFKHPFIAERKREEEPVHVLEF